MRAKKKLGQYFLKSRAIARAVAHAADLRPTDVVLEIGPGKGKLTKELLAFSEKVVAVEKDSELVSFLRDKFAEEITKEKLVVLEEDIRAFNPTVLQSYGPIYKIVANIPYYITGEILRRFLTSEYQPSVMVLMVQKEVAERVVARDGKESILSISVKVYGTPKIVKKVPRRYFSPPPEVDSSILKIENISRGFFEEEKVDEGRFFKLVRLGFRHKRKQLVNNLSEKFDREAVEGALKAADVPPKARAEELSREDWREVWLALPH